MFKNNILILFIIKNINLGQVIKLFLLWAKNNKVVFFMLSVSLFEVNQLNKLFNLAFTIISNVLRFSWE